jgi:hypothetical protein
MAGLMKGFGKGMFLVFVAWVPIIVVGSSEAWGPVLVGPDSYAAVMKTHVPWAFASIFAVVVFLWGMFLLLRPVFGVLKGASDDSTLRQTGRPARAKVLSLGESSDGIVTINDQPLLSVVLEVSDGFGSPYQVALETVVPRYAVPQVQPGSVVAVRVDRQNPQRVAIEWGALPPPA